MSLSLGFEASPAIGPFAHRIALDEHGRATGLAPRHVSAAGGDGVDADARGLGRRRGSRRLRVAGALGVGERVGVGDLGGARFGLAEGWWWFGDRGIDTDGGGRGGSARGVAVGAGAWERFLLGLDEALEEFRRANPEGLSGAGGLPSASEGSSPQAAPAAVPQGGSTSLRPTSDGLPFGEEPAPSIGTSTTIGSEATAAVISIIPAGAAGRRMSPTDTAAPSPIDAGTSANWLVLDAAIDEHPWQNVALPIEEGSPSFSKSVEPREPDGLGGDGRRGDPSRGGRWSVSSPGTPSGSEDAPGRGADLEERTGLRWEDRSPGIVGPPSRLGQPRHEGRVFRRPQAAFQDPDQPSPILAEKGLGIQP